ncbi:MAG: tRNA (adenosine(37)-N6)-threonylcarbamoyltransferase complex ATPase subunit type 1 TsaE [Patescibacteria group bacterium]
MRTLHSNSIEDTKKIAADVLHKCSSTNHVLLLSGDLGSGKTAFVKKLAEHMGVADTVTSPTFIIMSVYNTDHSQFKRLVHADMYRFESFTPGQVKELGLQEYLNDPESLVVIEWPEKLIEPPVGAGLDFVVTGETSRDIAVTGLGDA